MSPITRKACIAHALVEHNANSHAPTTEDALMALTSKRPTDGEPDVEE